MNTTGKIQNKGQVTIPTAVRRQAGLSKGDLVNFAFQRGKIVITPRLIVDRSKFPRADDEYTPAQRRAIDARLSKAEKGPFHGPFSSANSAIAHMKDQLKKRAAVKKLKRAAVASAGEQGSALLFQDHWRYVLHY
jgi:AbrB family looped-hinge helix DNA binding protein